MLRGSCLGVRAQDAGATRKRVACHAKMGSAALLGALRLGKTGPLKHCLVDVGIGNGPLKRCLGAAGSVPPKKARLGLAPATALTPPAHTTAQKHGLPASATRPSPPKKLKPSSGAPRNPEIPGRHSESPLC